MRVAIVGGGVFGVTTAIVLAQNWHSVDLYEQENDIFTHASGINQYRLHRGYHYPRSRDTMIECLTGEEWFRDFYRQAVLDDGIDHYYCIAKKDSKVSGNEFIEAMKDTGLEYDESYPDTVNREAVSLSVKVKEYLYDPVKLKETAIDYLTASKVNIILNHRATKEELLKKGYDAIVVATYCDNNMWVSKDRRHDYQFEIVEKLVLRLPEQYSNQSIVILDGAFMCIDPFGRTGYHAMGHVVHAIHRAVTGSQIVIPELYKEILNKGVVRNPKITNYNRFMEAAKEYFVGISDCVSVGSMFTIRTVLPFHDHDDARPTVVETADDKIITIFSGKIPTCGNAARKVLELLRR